MLIFFILFVISVNAQTNGKKTLPVWQSYKGVAIGMTADQVREKLGAPRSEDAEGFFYVFSETENAQILLDAAKKVRCISTVFTAEHAASRGRQDVAGVRKFSASFSPRIPPVDTLPEGLPGYCFGELWLVRVT